MAKKIVFYVNKEKPRAIEKCRELEKRAAELGFEAVKGDGDFVIALGGDGTILKAVHEFKGTPVLGLNLGGLGYLAAVGERDFVKALKRLATGEYQISERTLLEVNGRFPALNDVVLVREQSGHSALFDLETDGKVVTRYMADGVIFATPTGSTAYSLAAGGPVLMPDSASFVITPMNPHALGVRPLVVKDTASFRVTARLRTAGNKMKIGVYADGENVLTLEEGESVSIAKASRTAKLVELVGYDPYEVLARKLGWSGSCVEG